MVDSHTEADLGKWCAPICRQLGLLCVKISLPSCNVVWIFVAPKVRIVMEISLKLRIRKLISFLQKGNKLENVYLCAIDLHRQRPSSISATKVSHVAVNRNPL